jgi:xanthine dehydrogenase small subunit
LINFILNNKLIQTEEKPGSTLLDFVRYHQQLTGTKIGCREGDCGACTLLMGKLVDGGMHYKSLTSCITPLGNAQGKHIVSIEGLNMNALSPYQQAMVDSSGSQCGMCTVGFIVSFAGACLSNQQPTYEQLIMAIDGNICRCTGYKSIERATKLIAEKLANRPKENFIPYLIEHQFIPEYFNSIAERLRDIKPLKPSQGKIVVGGGTDLLVQKHDQIVESSVELFSDLDDLVGIEQVGDKIHIGAATNTTDLLESHLMNKMFENLAQHLKLVSSTPIRNIATVGGNLINASPIGDLTVFFMALNAGVQLIDSNQNNREILLQDFYKGYKQMDMSDKEHLAYISFNIPDEQTHFNFEKVSKRRYLDIASVNSAMSIRVEGKRIVDLHMSAGGVGPTPMYLHQTCQALMGKDVSVDNIRFALKIADAEIAPISDVRGSAAYKRLLLRQLIYAHFVALFPKTFKVEGLYE